jgi:hypothetical protein
LLSRHKERHSNSDKEYQWQYEDARIRCHSTIDTTFPNSTNVPDSSHSPPTTEAEVLAPLFMGPDNILHQHLRPDVSQQRGEARNYSPDSLVLEPARTPKTVHALMDQDIDFSYNDRNQQDLSQELNAPHLYDSCALWQDELAMSGNMPDFGGQGYNRSPFTMSDDFISFLLKVSCLTMVLQCLWCLWLRLKLLSRISFLSGSGIASNNRELIALPACRQVCTSTSQRWLETESMIQAVVTLDHQLLKITRRTKFSRR